MQRKGRVTGEHEEQPSSVGNGHAKDASCTGAPFRKFLKFAFLIKGWPRGKALAVRPFQRIILCRMSAPRGSSNDERTPLLTDRHRQVVDGAASSSSTADSPSVRVTSEDLDARFTRWLDYIARRNPKKAKTVSALEKSPQFLISVFEKNEDELEDVKKGVQGRWDGFIDGKDFVKWVQERDHTVSAMHTDLGPFLSFTASLRVSRLP
jgi:hypothetical protein